jgi:hypothetical protein
MLGIALALPLKHVCMYAYMYVCAAEVGLILQSAAFNLPFLWNTCMYTYVVISTYQQRGAFYHVCIHMYM